MSYSLFWTRVATSSEKTPDLRGVVPMNFNSIGAAINAACKLISDGAIVWRIKGADGFMMERRDIETEYWRRESKIQAKR